MDVASVLSEAPYPGRGILICRTKNDGLCAIYWLSGRSEASRHRSLVQDGINLLAVSLDGASDDPLRHYRAAHHGRRYDVIGNGDHVDEIAGALHRGELPASAINRLTPEPDSLGTPRIVSVVDRSTEGVIVGAARPNPSGEGIEHALLHAECISEGTGILVATYKGNPTNPSSWATPTWTDVSKGLGEILHSVWEAIPPSFRVAIAGRQLGDEGAWIIS
jgi:IMP cyclohydrolase